MSEELLLYNDLDRLRTDVESRKAAFATEKKRLQGSDQRDHGGLIGRALRGDQSEK